MSPRLETLRTVASRSLPTLMRRPFGVVALSLAVVSVAAGQGPKSPTTGGTAVKPRQPARGWTAPRTPWGDPDLQGVWNDATSTPLQRPTGVASKDVLDD